MRKISLTVAFLTLGLAYATAQRTTSYPLTGIVSFDPLLTPTGFKPEQLTNPEELNHYRYAHGASLKSILEVVRQNDLSLKPVVYTGGFTASFEIERGYRSAIAMSPNGRLATALDEKATLVRIDMGDDPEFPFRASTAEGDFTIDGSHYCFWVRVDDEFMKVTSVDPRAKTITVKRAFDNTAAAKHPAGSMVFTPVYNGNRLDPNPVRKKSAWPGTDNISYAMDPASGATHRYKADFIIEQLNEGYSGVWWDTFEARTFNLCDPIGRADYGKDGKSIFPWNFRDSAPYTPESIFEQMKLMSAATRDIVRVKSGVEPVICANNIGQNYAWMQSIIEPKVMLDVFCMEDAFLATTWEKGAVIDQKKLQGKQSPFSFEILGREQLFINKLTALAQSNMDGKPLIAMTGPAGWVSGHFTASQPNFHSLERYSWCSYLLTVQDGGCNLFGKPITITSDGDDKFRVVPLSEIYFYPVGKPAETKPIEQYRSDNQSVYTRRFENGIVIVSRLGEEESYTLSLPQSYVDPVTGGNVRQITLTGPDGAILLKKP